MNKIRQNRRHEKYKGTGCPQGRTPITGPQKLHNTTRSTTVQHTYKHK